MGLPESVLQSLPVRREWRRASKVAVATGFLPASGSPFAAWADALLAELAVVLPSIGAESHFVAFGERGSSWVATVAVGQAAGVALGLGPARLRIITAPFVVEVAEELVEAEIIGRVRPATRTAPA